MKREAIIVDLDGTLALRKPGGRGPYDWDRVLEDEPNVSVIAVVGAMQMCGYHTFFVSGRKEQCREHTALWLQRNGLVENHTMGNFHGVVDGFCSWQLYMRADNDSRADDLLKDQIFQEKIDPFFKVICVFDDRNSVVRMWREKHRLTVLQVAEGDF